jgi:hypothetical protein
MDINIIILSAGFVLVISLIVHLMLICKTIRLMLEKVIEMLGESEFIKNLGELNYPKKPGFMF